MEKTRYILTLSCPDKIGIVAAVTNWLLDHEGFIDESHHFGDAATGQFFMRTLFESPKELHDGMFQLLAQRFNMEFSLTPESHVPPVIIMVSKEGHCLNDLLHRISIGSLSMRVVGIVSNHETLRKFAEFQNIPFFYFPITTKEEQEQRVLDLIEKEGVELVIMARYMQILSDDFCKALPGKVINIHHSFLPSFKGAKPYHQAFARGVKLIGASAHYATADLDEGPIIDQETARVSHQHTPVQLREIGRDLENIVLARAVKYHIEKRVLLNKNKTVVFN